LHAPCFLCLYFLLSQSCPLRPHFHSQTPLSWSNREFPAIFSYTIHSFPPCCFGDHIRLVSSRPSVPSGTKISFSTPSTLCVVPKLSVLDFSLPARPQSSLHAAKLLILSAIFRFAPFPRFNPSSACLLPLTLSLFQFFSPIPLVLASFPLIASPRFSCWISFFFFFFRTFLLNPPHVLSGRRSKSPKVINYSCAIEVPSLRLLRSPPSFDFKEFLLTSVYRR